MSLLERFKQLFVVALLMLLMVVVRVLYGAVTELHAGENALAAQNPDEAIVHLERSLHWYVPFSPTIEPAASALWSIGQQAESQGNRARALEAFQAIRGALMATRSFYLPYRELVKNANERIASLQTEDPKAIWPDPTLSAEQRKDIALEVLDRDNAPDPAWAFLAVVGFIGWAGCASGFALKAFDSTGHFLRQPGFRWGAGILVGYAIWVLGLMRA